jgi:FkbM family methyltransferase
MLGKVNGRWGVCEYFLKDEYVGRSVRVYGEYGPDETEKILELRGSGLFLDVGANIGCISQAVLASGGRVMAFEPQREVYEVMARNLAYAGSGWEAMNVAVGSAEGTAKMEVLDYSVKNNIGGLGLGAGSNPWGRYREVPVVTLDGLGLEERVSFIKIDVEGYELEVLRGAVELIKRDKPVLYVENDRADKSAALKRFISEELGYWFESHDPPLFRANNFFKSDKNVWGVNYVSVNLLCRPK